jgi:hypothetical protein
MKIHAIKHDSANATQLDLNQFSKELRVLSDRFGVELVSLGAMATVERAGKGATYLAIWETQSDENQGN